MTATPTPSTSPSSPSSPAPAPESDTTRTVLRAEGFSCPSCVSKIEKQVGRLDGVSLVKVNFASARIDVAHDPAIAPVDALVGAVAKAGYAAHPAAF